MKLFIKTEVFLITYEGVFASEDSKIAGKRCLPTFLASDTSNFYRHRKSTGTGVPIPTPFNIQVIAEKSLDAKENWHW